MYWYPSRALVGVIVGLPVGESLGTNDGTELGVTDGNTLGLDGKVLGLILGTTDGVEDGDGILDTLLHSKSKCAGTSRMFIGFHSFITDLVRTFLEL